MSAKATYCEIRTRINAAGPDGISRAALLVGLDAWVLKRAMERAKRDGQPLIFRRFFDESVSVMFFATVEDRARFDAKHKAAVAARRKASSRARDNARNADKRKTATPEELAAIRARKAKNLRESRKAAREAAAPSVKMPKPPPKPKHVPKPITLTKPKSRPPSVSFAHAEADYSRAVVTVAPTPKPRFAVELAKGHVSALDPQECRPWAQFAG